MITGENFFLLILACIFFYSTNQSLFITFVWVSIILYVIRAAFVCLSLCLFVPLLLRGPLTDLRQTWWVGVGGPPNCP